MRQDGRGTMLCDARKGILRGFQRRAWGVLGTLGAGCGGGQSFAVGGGRNRPILSFGAKIKDNFG